MVARVFAASMYLFPQGRSPLYESPEVTLSENLKVIAVCENLWCCQIKATPPGVYLSDASLI
jgi:hypothetical protein